jgi:hypothetical protein
MLAQAEEDSKICTITIKNKEDYGKAKVRFNIS